jgi:hypothetical protein
MVNSPEIFITFTEGYQSVPIQIDQKRLKKVTGIIAIAYSRFAETEQRLKLGLTLLNEIG